MTNETFTTAMYFDISTVFYVVSFEIIKSKEQEKKFKEMQRHGNKR